MLLLGTEQINCISLEFPLLHQSPFLVDVGEKRHGWPRYLSESCLMRQGVQGELSQDALCTRGGLWGFPSSHGLHAIREGVVLCPPRSVSGGTWVGALTG